MVFLTREDFLFEINVVVTLERGKTRGKHEPLDGTMTRELHLLYLEKRKVRVEMCEMRNTTTLSQCTFLYYRKGKNNIFRVISG